MAGKHEIPCNIIIDVVNCRVWYKGQPLVCDICNNNHKTADCPLKGKYRRCHEAGHFVPNCPKPVWYVPGNPATDVDSDNDNDHNYDNDVNEDGVEDVNNAIDVRDNELDELVSQPLLNGSGVAEERVLDPSPSLPLPSDCVLEASTGRSGVPQEEVLESSPSFSPPSGTCLLDTP